MALQNILIAAGADDGDENQSTGLVNIAAVTINLRVRLLEPNGGGWKLRGLLAGRKSAITSAIFSLTPTASYGAGTLDGTFYGEAYRAPGDLVATTGNIMSRPRTVASVPWAPGALTIDVPVTIDLTPIVQELVNKNDWTAGDDIVLIFLANNGSNQAPHTFYSRDGSAVKCAFIDVDYDNTGAVPVVFTTLTLSPAASADDALQIGAVVTIADLNISCREHTTLPRHSGVRVVGPIPKGATIQTAYLRWICGLSATDGTFRGIVYANDVDDAAAFVAVNNNITGRALTAGVTWMEPISWVQGCRRWIGVTYCSPDMAVPVQAVVNRPGWAPNNHLALLFIASMAVDGAETQIRAFDFGSLYPIIEVNYTEPVGIFGEQSFPEYPDWSPSYLQGAPEGANAYASLYGLHSKIINLGQRRWWQELRRR